MCILLNCYSTLFRTVNHAKNMIAGRIIPILVPGFRNINTRICAAPRHIAVFFGHYQDRGISSLKGHDSACYFIISVGTVTEGADNPTDPFAMLVGTKDSAAKARPVPCRTLPYTTHAYSRANCVHEHNATHAYRSTCPPFTLITDWLQP